MDDDIVERRGQPTTEYYYNIHTPRSNLYIFEECELEPYIEDSESVDA